jgi:hypothetical protein
MVWHKGTRLHHRQLKITHQYFLDFRALVHSAITPQRGPAVQDFTHHAIIPGLKLNLIIFAITSSEYSSTVAPNEYSSVKFATSLPQNTNCINSMTWVQQRLSPSFGQIDDSCFGQSTLSPRSDKNFIDPLALRRDRFIGALLTKTQKIKEFFRSE